MIIEHVFLDFLQYPLKRHAIRADMLYGRSANWRDTATREAVVSDFLGDTVASIPADRLRRGYLGMGLLVEMGRQWVAKVHASKDPVGAVIFAALKSALGDRANEERAVGSPEQPPASADRIRWMLLSAGFARQCTRGSRALATWIRAFVRRIDSKWVARYGSVSYGTLREAALQLARQVTGFARTDNYRDIQHETSSPNAPIPGATLLGPPEPIQRVTLAELRRALKADFQATISGNRARRILALAARVTADIVAGTHLPALGQPAVADVVAHATIADLINGVLDARPAQFRHVWTGSCRKSQGYADFRILRQSVMRVLHEWQRGSA